MSERFSRRTLGRLLGGASAALSLPSTMLASPAPAPPQPPAAGARTFPTDFLWGSATASYQVEGAVKEGGRGPSIWDTFAHTPGKTFHGDNGDIADDYYHRYRDDIRLMKDIGLKTCRFSVSWTRIFPTGTGAPNQPGVDFYRRMCEALLEAGIQPYCTLYHWDLPQPLQDRGGWENKDTSKAFADYAGYFAAKTSDIIHSYMTMNEMRIFTELGYGNGQHAPGLKVGRKRLAQLCHHVVYGHGLAVQAIRAQAKQGTRIGVADNPNAITPVLETREHIEAAYKAIREENASFTTALLEGRYTDGYLRRMGGDAPVFTPDEMKAVGSPMDFVGINIYTPLYVRADGSELGYAIVQPDKSYPTMYSPWLFIGPEALYWVPKLFTHTWKPKEIFITENGASAADVVASDGHIYDSDRVMYLRNYLTQLQRAVAEGVPVKGYFLWSLLDNFEWADGYDKRFGITYVDFETQKRTPKLSADFYKNVIRENRVV